MNIMTNSMQRLTKMLLQTDARLKEFGKEPYGVRKATPKEQREMYENLTEPQFFQMVDTYGIEAVNKWLKRFEQGGDNG